MSRHQEQGLVALHFADGTISDPIPLLLLVTVREYGTRVTNLEPLHIQGGDETRDVVAWSITSPSVSFVYHLPRTYRLPAGAASTLMAGAMRWVLEPQAT